MCYVNANGKTRTIAKEVGAHLISKKLYYNLGRQLQIDEGRIIFNEPILRKALSFLHQLTYVKK